MPFSMERLGIGDVFLIKPQKFVDERGYFMETYSRRPFAEAGIPTEFIQDNQSLSVRVGTLRGLHFQRSPVAQAKLVSVLRGSVFDVAVDIRPNSPTFGKWCGARLTADGGEQLFIPREFAHGFVTLEPNSMVAYKVDAPYSREAEGGILWNDPALQIDWPLPPGGPIMAERDSQLPLLENIANLRSDSRNAALSPAWGKP